MTRYTDPFNPQQTLDAIAAAVKWREQYAFPQGNTKREKEIRANFAMLKDGDYQNFRTQQLWFSPLGANEGAITKAEENTLRLKNHVANMSDDQVAKFERIHASYPNQSPGFYAALVDNPDFDVTHPEFENVAALDLEENAKQETLMKPKRIGPRSFIDDALNRFGGQEFVPVPGSYYTSGRHLNTPGLPTGNQYGDTSDQLPPDGNLYGVGSLEGVNEGLNEKVGGFFGWLNKLGQGEGWLDPVRAAGRFGFSVLTSPYQAEMGALRSTVGAFAKPGDQSFGSRLGEAGLSAGSLLIPGLGRLGDQAFGEENFQSAWEQSFAGQMLEHNTLDMGEGWFPAGKVAEYQAKSVWEAYNLDNQVWSLGVQAAHSMGMDPSTSAYHFWSGLIDLTSAIAFDPTTYLGGASIPSKLLAIGGKKGATKLADVGVIGAERAAQIESITIRGGTRRAIKRDEARKAALMESVAKKGGVYEYNLGTTLIDAAEKMRSGEAATVSPELMGVLEREGGLGIQRAAQDHVAAYEGAKPKSMDARIAEIDRLAAEEGLADEIEVPSDLTGVDADFYKATTAMLRNQALMDTYHNQAVELTDNAAHMRRPGYEEEFVSTYVRDVGEQLDLTASTKMMDIGDDLRADPTAADNMVRQALDDIEQNQGMSAIDIQTTLEGLVMESRYGPLPESIYTVGEPQPGGATIGRINGEDAVVHFADPERAKGADKIIDDAQAMLTGGKKPHATRIMNINKNLLERLNIDGDVALRTGVPQPKDINQPVNYQNFTAMLYDADGKMYQGADLMAALLRLINAEPQYSRNLAIAQAPVPDHVLLQVYNSLLEIADSVSGEINGVVGREMKTALADIGNKDLTVARITEDMLNLTNLRALLEGTIGKMLATADPAVPSLNYGELLAIAGRVGGHGRMAEILAENGIQGVRALKEDGTGIWWTDRSIISAASVDLDEVMAGRAAKVGPLKHNDPNYFLVTREEGKGYTARTIGEARRYERTTQRQQLANYFQQIRIGAKAAADARKGFTARERAQQELQYHAARTIAGMDTETSTILDDVSSFLDESGIKPTQQQIDELADRLILTGQSWQNTNKVLADGLRGDSGIFTDFLSKDDIPYLDPRLSLNMAKRQLNLDSKMSPITTRAIEKLAKNTDLAWLIKATKNKWDPDAYQATIANAHRTETVMPDGSTVPYTDAMRVDDFIRTAGSNVGLDLRNSIRSIRTVIEPGDGAKFGRTMRSWPGQKLDRWAAYAPNKQIIDLSNKTQVIQRIIDYGAFHRLGNEEVNKSLAILFGDGNVQQLSRLALEDSLNRVYTAIMENVTKGHFDDAQMATLRAEVRKATSYSFNRDNELAKTYTEQATIDGAQLVEVFNAATGKTEMRPPPTHMHFNEQVGSQIAMPSTLDLIGLQRKIPYWRDMIGRVKLAESEGDKSLTGVLGATGRAFNYLYLNFYRTSLLLRPAYVFRNLLEMQIRMFLANSPVNIFSHPMRNIQSQIGLISPALGENASWFATKKHPAMLRLKEHFGRYDQTPLDRDLHDYGDDIADIASRNEYWSTRGTTSMNDERMLGSAGFAKTEYPVAVTHSRWVEGYAHELFALRSGAVSRLVARDGLTASQLKFLNFHLEKTGRQPIPNPIAGETESSMFPIAVWMKEALDDPDALKASLNEYFDSKHVPEGAEPSRRAQIDGMGEWDIDQVYLYLDKMRSGEVARADGTPTTSQLATESAENINSVILSGPGGYVELLKRMTMDGDQRLKDYIAFGRFDPEGNPLRAFDQEGLKILTDRDGKKEVKNVRAAIHDHWGPQIEEAKTVYDSKLGGEPTEGASVIADILANVRVFVNDQPKGRVGVIDPIADVFFGLSSKAERRTSMGPEFRARYWQVMGDNVDHLSVETLAGLEDAALRTLSPLRRLTVKHEIGLPIGESHPFFKGVQRRKDKIDEYNVAKAEVETAKAEGRAPDPDALAKMEEHRAGIDEETATDVADAMAYDHVADLFYNASRKRNIWHSMRYASLFVAPAVNTLTVWSRLMFENPVQTYKAYRAMYALQQEGTGDVINGPEEGMDELERALAMNDPNKAFLYKDDTGWKINVPLIGTAFTLAPGGVQPGMLGDKPFRTMQYRLESLNFAMSGGTILPGVSPLISIGYEKFKGETDSMIESNLDKWIQPFGDRALLENTMPAWLIKSATGFSAAHGGPGFGMNDEMILLNLRPALSMLYETGNYPQAMTDKRTNDALYEDAMRLAAHMTFWQGVGQGIMPAAPMVDWAVADKTGDSVGIGTVASLFYDDYLVESNGDYEGSMAKLYEDFGMAGIFALTGARENLGRIPSSEGWDWVVQNRELADAYDKYIYFFFPTDEPDMQARNWLESRDKRRQLTGPELMTASQRQFKIMATAQVNAKYAGGLISEDDASAKKKEIDARFGDVSSFAQKDIATPDQFPNMLDRMLREPALLNTNAGRAASYAMTWRKHYMDQAELTGESLGTKKNTALREEYEARLDGLVAKTGGYNGSDARLIIDMLKKEF